MTPQQIIAQICREFGSQLKVPAPLDGAKVLWALAGCESDFGAYATTRHEPGYCRGGRYFDAAMTRKWGCAAHCSYGPWQIMYAHLGGYDPALFAFCAGAIDDHFVVGSRSLARCAIAMLNGDILGHQKATTLEQIAKAWNHGNWADAYDDSEYTNRAAKFYEVPFPALEVS